MSKTYSIVGVLLSIALIVCYKMFAPDLFGTNKSRQSRQSKQATNEMPDSIRGAGFSNATIFKEYKYGQPLSLYSSNSEYTDCSDVFGQTALCKENVQFLGHMFTAGLLFDNQQLTTVSLYTPYSDQLYTTIVSSLPQNNFGLFLLKDSKQQIDVLESFKTKGSDLTLKQINEFESRLADEPEINFSFVENPQQYQSCKNITELLLQLKDDTRGLDLSLEEDTEGSWLYLTFSFPKKDLQNMIKKETF